MTIFEAAENGKLKELKKLIKDGADLNAKDNDGRTAMMWAEWNGHTDCVTELIAAGADVNAKNNDGSTALMLAARDGHNDCVAALIAAGADVNAKDNDGWPALMYAAWNGNKDCVKLLKKVEKEPKEKTIKVKLKPHLQKIVNYIRKHGSVTVREATLSKELNTVELRKRISEINRAKGYEFIKGTYEPNRDGGQHKRYRLCK